MIKMEKGKISTAMGSSNIALGKYWGKRDDKLILPMNSSISLTLGEELSTRTSVVFSDDFKEDSVYINGEREVVADSSKDESGTVLRLLRAAAETTSKCLVVSENSFPTASGLASSASGIATLTYAASHALGLDLDATELSKIARQGSGSACRSLFGGAVKWNAGTMPDGSDSYAVQLFDQNHWPELTDIIAITDARRKRFPSRAGMKQTIQTSVLYKARMAYVNDALTAIETALKDRDFETLAERTMRESNDLHAVAMDTWPPLFYLNDISKAIIYRIHELNDSAGKFIAAYTFDAGANAHVITTAQNADSVKAELSKLDGVVSTMRVGIGAGPRMLGDSDSLINANDLSPILKH